MQLILNGGKVRTQKRMVFRSDAADGSGGESVHPNPEFPDEESIRQAVLADEFAAEQAQNTARKKEKRDAGSLLKDLIFGKE